MKYLSTLIVFAFFPLVVMSQSPKTLFDNAKVSYENGKVKEALTYVLQAESALGKSNPKIESLKAYCYSDLKDWTNAYLAVKKYMAMVPSSQQNADAHKDMKLLEQSIVEQVKSIDKAYKEQLINDRMKAANSFVENEDSKTRSRANVLQTQSESRLYKLYQNSNNPDELAQFANFFPKAKASEAVLEKKNYVEYLLEGNKAFRRFSFDAALKAFSKAYNIKKSDTLLAKIENAREELAYQRATDSKDLKDYLSYFEKYPNGKYINPIANGLLKFYNDEAAKAIKAKNYSAIQTNLNDAKRFLADASADVKKVFYQTKLEGAKTLEDNGRSMRNNSTYYADVQRHYSDYLTYNKDADIEKHLKRLNSKYKRWFTQGSDALMLAYRVDKQNHFGIDLGMVPQNAVGGFISIRGNSYFFDDPREGGEPFQLKNQTDETHLRSFATFNLSKKIIKPIWVYAGAGVAGFMNVENIDKLGNGQQSYVTSKVFVAPNAEVGLHLVVGPVVLSGGASIPFFNAKQKANLHLNSSPIIPNAALGIVFDF